MTDKEQSARTASTNKSAESLVRMRNRSTVVLTIGIVLSVAAVCGIAWTITQSTQRSDIIKRLDGGNFGQNLQNADGPRGAVSGARMINVDVTTYLNTDGSVNDDQIQTIATSINTLKTNTINRLQTRLDAAVSENTITQDQADKIMSAVKEATDTNE